MGLSYPLFGINFKVYEATIGDAGLDLARTVQKVRRETGVELTVTPQLPDLRRISRETELKILAARMDALSPGRGMGRILPETIADAGASAVVINHAENRDTFADIVRKIERCREVGIESIVCVDSRAMGEAILTFEPDAVLYEKPGDISTDRAITQTHPERVEEFVAMVANQAPDTRVHVGGGIRTPEDVRLAFKQGADATGAASGVCLVDDPEATIRAFADAVPTR